MIAKRVLLILAAMLLVPFLFAIATPARTASATVQLKFTLLLVLPLLSALILVAALRFNAEAAAKLATVIVACMAAIFCVELLFPVMTYVTARAKLQSSTDETIDQRDKLQVVFDLRDAGVDAVPSIEPKGFLLAQADGTRRSRISDGSYELLPAGGVANQLTVVCNETGNWITYQSDRYGMNNTDSVWDRDTVSVSTVGDSFTNGWCSSTEEHYVPLIRARHPDTINLAQSGNGPLLILASILEYLPSVRPEKVVWFHYEGNDFLDLDTESRSSLLMRYLQGDETQELAGRQAAIDREIRSYVDSASEEWRDLGNLTVSDFTVSLAVSSIKSRLKLARVRQLMGLTYSDGFVPDYELWARVLAKANRTVQSWGGEMFVVYLPSGARYVSIVGSGGAYEADRQRVRAAVDELGIRFIDMHDVFADHSRPLSLYNSIRGGSYGHYSAVGNALVSRAVLDALDSATDR